MDTVVASGAGQLAAHLARPRQRAGFARPGLVLCHGFPAAELGAPQAGATYPQLADWLAAEANWTVLAFNFRGAGSSAGQFSLRGWMADLRAAVNWMRSDQEVSGVWLAGFRDGGSLALCLAGEDPDIKGVAALAARVDFERWASDPRRFLEQARRVGVITDRSFPPDADAWSRELRELRPLTAAAGVPPRPFLVVHGTDDSVVPIMEARALVDAADNQVEFRVLNGAGHHLRHDPRAVAILLGWLERQGV
ncbi:MAG TPA: alpha/beta fold hydrolase [Acidimicrobiales bacterium]|nr:alpha/beta fold hydrolase [Acidimicrobiales bacterium]